MQSSALYKSAGGKGGKSCLQFSWALARESMAKLVCTERKELSLAYQPTWKVVLMKPAKPSSRKVWSPY